MTIEIVEVGDGTIEIIEVSGPAGVPGVVAAAAPATFNPSTHTVGVAVGTAAGTVAAGNDARLSDQRVPVDGSVTPAKLSFDPATQVELDAEVARASAAEATKADAAATTAALAGKADLSGGKVVTSQLPALAVNEVFPVANQAAMLALTAQRGDVAVRADNAHQYMLAADDATVLANWVDLGRPTADVTSVNGQAGVVVLGAADVSADAAGAAAAVQAASLQRASNLSDVASASTARTNLGLGGAATLNVGTASGTVAAGNDARVVAAEQTTNKDAASGYAGLSAAKIITGAAGITPLGATGATTASTWKGATTGGPPSTGTWAVGDIVADRVGRWWTCIIAGTPGTWVSQGAELGRAELATSQNIDTTTGFVVPGLAITVTVPAGAQVNVETHMHCTKDATTGWFIGRIYQDGSVIQGVATYPAQANQGGPMSMSRVLSPTAGSHTYTVGAWTSAGAGTVFALAGQFVPYLRATLC